MAIIRHYQVNIKEKEKKQHDIHISVYLYDILF
jgi:hypothetical protein